MSDAANVVCGMSRALQKFNRPCGLTTVSEAGGWFRFVVGPHRSWKNSAFDLSTSCSAFIMGGRPVATFQGLGEQNTMWTVNIFAFITCLQQIFLGTTEFGRHKCMCLRPDERCCYWLATNVAFTKSHRCASKHGKSAHPIPKAILKQVHITKPNLNHGYTEHQQYTLLLYFKMMQGILRVCYLTGVMTDVWTQKIIFTRVKSHDLG